MLRDEKIKSEIVRYLTYMDSYVTYHNDNGLTDINKQLEDFFIKPLNLCLDTDLINLNSEEKDYPCIDLGDLNKTIAIQVTSNKRKDKIQDTIVEHCISSKNLLNKYPNLYFLIISTKKIKRENKDFDKKELLNFDVDKNIIFLKDMVDILEGKNKLEETLKFFKEKIDIPQSEILSVETEIFRKIFKKISEINDDEQGNIVYEFDNDDIEIKKDRFSKFWDLICANYNDIVVPTRESIYIKSLQQFDESDQKRVRDFLRSESRKSLLNNLNNPIDAIKELKNILMNKLGNMLVSEVDVEYFLYFELFNCDVFPN